VPAPGQGALLALANVVIVTVGSEESFFGGAATMTTAVRAMSGAANVRVLLFKGFHCYETPRCVARVRAIIRDTLEL